MSSVLLYDLGMVTTISGVPSDDLRAWMTAHGYTVRSLARALEREPRTIQRYRDGSLPVPRVIELALRGLEHS